MSGGGRGSGWVRVVLEGGEGGGSWVALRDGVKKPWVEKKCGGGSGGRCRGGSGCGVGVDVRVSGERYGGLGGGGRGGVGWGVWGGICDGVGLLQQQWGGRGTDGGIVGCVWGTGGGGNCVVVVCNYEELNTGCGLGG